MSTPPMQHGDAELISHRLYTGQLCDIGAMPHASLSDTLT